MAVLQRKAASSTSVRRWTSEELYLLIQLWPHHNNKFIARKLNRSVYAIERKRVDIGLPIKKYCFKPPKEKSDETA